MKRGMIDTAIVAGARPNFVKIAPLIEQFHLAGIATRLIHTGQHYDHRMSDVFFEELDIPAADVNLGVGSGSHVYQLSHIMLKLEEEFSRVRPRVVVVVGDVNSTLAAALAANKMSIAVAHVEAGLRSFDRTMPEEINRQVVDSIADWLFTSEPSGNRNLLGEGVDSARIFLVGNVMIDTLRKYLPKAQSYRAYERWDLPFRQYAVVTLHRPSNVDCPERLTSILRALQALGRRMPVVFAAHPRTRQRLRELGFDNTQNGTRLIFTDPLPYLVMLSLVDASRIVLTDSGGLQEETTALQVPCLTLRENTERPITVELGSNRLVGWRSDTIAEAVEEVLSGPERYGQVPELWDGRAAERIAVRVKEVLANEKIPAPFLEM